MTQYAIVTDLNRCVGCLACVVACKSANGVPIGSFWTKVLRVGPNPKYEGAHFPDTEMYFLPLGCQHCANPECVKVCPTGASKKQADGTVQIDKEKCIGCQFCVMACPYGVRYLNEEERVVEKCTLCEQKISQGLLPQCVAQCQGRARWFGDLEKGLSTFEAPGYAGGSKDYDTLQKTRFTIAGQTGKSNTVAIEPFTDSDVHALPDVGNGPSFRYILRNRVWHG